MTILILHGIMGHSQENWFPWLKSELTKLGHTVLVPDLPNPNRPSRQAWLRSVSSLLANTTPSQVTIVGHSLGVTTALDYLELAEDPIKQLISVSGFHQDYGLELNSFFLAEKTINLKKVKKNCQNISVIYSDKDPYVPEPTLKALADGLGVLPIIIKNGGHLGRSAGFTEFPLLLEIINSNS